MVDFSRMHAAEMGAFGERFTLLDGVAFTGILVKRSTESVNNVGFRQVVESWHLLVTPEDAAPIDLAIGIAALDGSARFVEMETATGQRYQVQSRQVNADGLIEYLVSLVR